MNEAGAFSLDNGLLVIRLIFGLMITGHGAQKLFGFHKGPGIAGMSGWLESIGYKPAKLFAIASGVAEFASGILIALGFLGPVGPALMISVMIVAIMTTHRGNGLFSSTNGVEVPLLYIAAAIGLAMTGFGSLSMDWRFGYADMWTPGLIWIVLLVGLIGGFVNSFARTPPPPASSAPSS